jgi:hypothetical protein
MQQKILEKLGWRNKHPLSPYLKEEDFIILPFLQDGG